MGTVLQYRNIFKLSYDFWVLSALLQAWCPQSPTWHRSHHQAWHLHRQSFGQISLTPCESPCACMAGQAVSTCALTIVSRNANLISTLYTPSCIYIHITLYTCKHIMNIWQVRMKHARLMFCTWLNWACKWSPLLNGALNSVDLLTARDPQFHGSNHF